MDNDYKENDYLWIKELLDYPANLETNLGSFRDTSQINLPLDPIDFPVPGRPTIRMCPLFWAIFRIARLARS